jgi:hypothetical protein
MKLLYLLSFSLLVVKGFQNVHGIEFHHGVRDTLSDDTAELLQQLPSGDYTNSCTNCVIDKKSILTCSCTDKSQSRVLISSLSNANVCNECITNQNGVLECSLPEDAGYLENCAGCGVSYGILNCTCSGNTTASYTLANACSSCQYGVAFTKGSLQCSAVQVPTSTRRPTPRKTRRPTRFPTFRPSLKPTTLNPTPKTPKPVKSTCASYWAKLNGVEGASEKACGSTDFHSMQGCQNQNYCCWQQASGTCILPQGVPIDCPPLIQSTCIQYSSYCTWSTADARCQRKCPGDPNKLCSS